MSATLVTMNAGSSSIKVSLYQHSKAGLIERQDAANFQQVQSSHDSLHKSNANAQGFSQVIDWLTARVDLRNIAAMGHRIVHGGNRFHDSIWLDDQSITGLQTCIPLAPNHLPGEIELITHFKREYPAIRQAACFDTAFHATLPSVASLLPIPRRFQQTGLRRFGFHGISYAYLMSELRRMNGAQVEQEKIVLAHLGNGASMAAVEQGRSVDTTMCLTPTAGLVMGTRTGDLDPGILLYLMREFGLSETELDHIVTKKSGLLGLSETTSDMRELLACRHSDLKANEAVSVFCYQARKQIGAYMAALGGIDTLVFSGGIGERSHEIRQEICHGLSALGIRLDPNLNQSHAPVISASDSLTTVRVIETNEEIMIARELVRLLEQSAS